ncbi:hypothetical protein UFOVP276_16 [uncultured Caudovirales phage]|uniref:Uncharacterized protein n=1 Tax=uncultured Caudovirales phage TaxID=2100421 RepID=A0A6J5LPA7_9CAUD|nr:hypothetical protein UFOVP127_153 [uncultured Caudovirales phage]CAB4134817.1 hypothetical protein UFOVP276_16 [uncultured Caudovirales phage]
MTKAKTPKVNTKNILTNKEKASLEKQLNVITAKQFDAYDKIEVLQYFDWADEFIYLPKAIRKLADSVYHQNTTEYTSTILMRDRLLKELGTLLSGIRAYKQNEKEFIRLVRPQIKAQQRTLEAVNRKLDNHTRAVEAGTCTVCGRCGKDSKGK